MAKLFQFSPYESNTSDIRRRLNSVRLSILRMHYKSQTSHVASSLSCADIIYHLCLEKKLRDHNQYQSGIEIVFSKGHAASAFYASLAEIGELGFSDLDSYCTDGSHLYGHISHLAHPWINLSTGSLGHGLPFGLGLTIANRISGSQTITSVLMSDGEINEGTTWECALIASALNLNSLICFIDANGLQSLDFVENVLPLEPLTDKWRAFGWNVHEIDGHDETLFESIELHELKPTVVILRTVKGKGVSFMENDLAWHYKSPTDDNLKNAISELMSE